MKTKSTEFIYQDTKIHFALSTDKNVMVNATEMAKAFNKRIDVFLKTEPTKAFIKLLEFPPVGVNSSPLKKKEIISTHGQNGTYFTRLLAVKFAMWLDPVFELWVINTIDEIMFGEYKIHQQAIEATLKAEKEIENLELQLAQNPAFQKIQALKNFIKTKDSEKRKALKEKKNQIEMNFNTSKK
jgi:hypothetical protein